MCVHATVFFVVDKLGICVFVCKNVSVEKSGFVCDVVEWCER